MPLNFLDKRLAVARCQLGYQRGTGKFCGASSSQLHWCASLSHIALFASRGSLCSAAPLLHRSDARWTCGRRRITGNQVPSSPTPRQHPRRVHGPGSCYNFPCARVRRCVVWHLCMCAHVRVFMCMSGRRERNSKFRMQVCVCRCAHVCVFVCVWAERGRRKDRVHVCMCVYA